MTYDPRYPCDGCGGADATECLWLAGPLGDSAVWVHKDRDCAEAARQARGGGRFIPERPTKNKAVALRSAAQPRTQEAPS